MSLRSIVVPAGHRLVRVADEPGLWRPANDMCSASWPEFMQHDPVADRCWSRLRDDWPMFQLVLVDDAGRVAAASQAAPLCWDGSDEGLPDGWDAQFERSVADLLAARTPDALGAIQINVAPDRRSQGLSTLILEAMMQTALEAGLGALIACVRPTEKSRYPLLPIETYAAWRRPDGLPFDPWLRVHARAGGRLVRPSPRSMTMEGSVAEWQAWTGLTFPASGPYVVEGALSPVEIDLARDRGVYHDPNVWVIHDLVRRQTTEGADLSEPSPREQGPAE
jgi:GNAT superfamily N-acetyltransferase